MNPVLQLTATDWLNLFNHFAALSLLAVGGAITTAPDMHRFLVAQQAWLSDGQFTAAIALAQAAQQRRPDLLRTGLIHLPLATLPVQGLRPVGQATSSGFILVASPGADRNTIAAFTRLVRERVANGLHPAR